MEGNDEMSIRHYVQDAHANTSNAIHVITHWKTLMGAYLKLLHS